ARPGNQRRSARQVCDSCWHTPVRLPQGGNHPRLLHLAFGPPRTRFSEEFLLRPVARLRSTRWEHPGDKEKVFGDGPEAASRRQRRVSGFEALCLTAECSNVELPGNAQRACFHSITRNRIPHDLSVACRMLTTIEPLGSVAS